MYFLIYRSIFQLKKLINDLRNNDIKHSYVWNEHEERVWKGWVCQGGRETRAKPLAVSYSRVFSCFFVLSQTFSGCLLGSRPDAVMDPTTNIQARIWRVVSSPHQSWYFYGKERGIQHFCSVINTVPSLSLHFLSFHFIISTGRGQVV